MVHFLDAPRNHDQRRHYRLVRNRLTRPDVPSPLTTTKMSRREAAQILGIRESAPVQKIKESHRRILMANHPDRGGSPYVATKINEAKELLIKGRS